MYTVFKCVAVIFAKRRALSAANAFIGVKHYFRLRRLGLGLWHHAHLNGQPFIKTAVLIPGPSFMQNFCMLKIVPVIFPHLSEQTARPPSVRGFPRGKPFVKANAAHFIRFKYVTELSVFSNILFT